MLRIIAGSARGRRFEAPAGKDTRPTLDRVRENLFNMLQGRCMDARVLDLFAGSGALSLEALSRGAEWAVMADRDREAHRIERKNAGGLGFQEKCRILLSPWERTIETLKREEGRFDLIFLDPPYAMTDLREMTAALRPLMDEDGWIVLEHQADARPAVAEGFRVIKERKWGYCGVTIYGADAPEDDGTEGTENAETGSRSGRKNNEQLCDPGKL